MFCPAPVGRICRMAFRRFWWFARVGNCLASTSLMRPYFLRHRWIFASAYRTPPGSDRYYRPSATSGWLLLVCVFFASLWVVLFIQNFSLALDQFFRRRPVDKREKLREGMRVDLTQKVITESVQAFSRRLKEWMISLSMTSEYRRLRTFWKVWWFKIKRGSTNQAA